MENLTKSYELADLICEEHQELLWEIIKDVQKREDGSLLKLASSLTEDIEWIEHRLSE